MRAQAAALLGAGGLPAAGGLAMVLAWFYGFDQAAPVPGMAFLLVAVVALAWSTWLRRRPPRAVDDDQP